jgi:hypothetical protein
MSNIIIEFNEDEIIQPLGGSYLTFNKDEYGINTETNVKELKEIIKKQLKALGIRAGVGFTSRHRIFKLVDFFNKEKELEEEDKFIFKHSIPYKVEKKLAFAGALIPRLVKVDSCLNNLPYELIESIIEIYNATIYEEENINADIIIQVYKGGETFGLARGSLKKKKKRKKTKKKRKPKHKKNKSKYHNKTKNKTKNKIQY